ncbi:DUF4179 domain-containing protein [Clostridium gasigenes]|uniref:DUF4179 domain-containing protein n=1 Tax=Clostridium gasigenes TaxID=94869 RepID=UPI0014383B47|nr:DUF4179 domain-containing protein [Clostridium gasigenes]MBU3103202.1 DUF4179 domain-containing protein [Clostridium gasigenes]NKF07474.1 DUF4179 domain-containing protein [Clostridium gasigenes]QSW17914.1 DUF4179 domain-containing protein [Clostridium gasigenes]
MKDIYELLNEANIDVTEIDVNKIEEMEVSELERKRGKKKLMASIKTKKRTSKKVAMVASLVIIIGISSIVIAKPAWAMDIPLIGDLIQKNLINNNSKYKDYIQAVGQTKSDQGIDITFESAIADNNVLNLSFVVKNNNESIENNIVDAMVIPTSLEVNGEKINASSGGSHEIIDANTIRVLKKINWDYNKVSDKLDVGIEISEMYGKKGNWSVNFALDTKEIAKNTYVEKLDKVIKVDGVDIKLDKLTMTPLTININYSAEYKDKEVYLNFLMFDENGVEVINNGNDGSSSRVNKIIEGSCKYINNTNAKQLNIIPFYDKYRMEENNEIEKKLASTKINIEEYSPLNLKINEDASIDINDWIVDGEFLIVKYSYRYLDTELTNTSLAKIYINVDGEDVSKVQSWNEEDEEKKNNLYSKYNESNRDGLMRIVKIGDSKNIEIGCYDGSSIEIFNDQAFTVTKK